MVFQNYALYPHMTVEQNMGFSLMLQARAEGGNARSGWTNAAGILGLDQTCSTAIRASFPAASASASPWAGPSSATRAVFLFDEPLSNLDAQLRVQMRTEIKDLHQRAENDTSIYVTHDQIEAMTMADRDRGHA